MLTMKNINQLVTNNEENYYQRLETVLDNIITQQIAKNVFKYNEAYSISIPYSYESYHMDEVEYAPLRQFTEQSNDLKKDISDYLHTLPDNISIDTIFDGDGTIEVYLIVKEG